MKSIFALIVVAACGGGPLDPGAGSDPGSGTHTLLVTGSATASPRLANASAPTDFDTDFTIRLSLNNVPVTTGTVTAKSKFTTVTLMWNQNGGGGNGQGGRWEGTANAYDEVYELDVTSGADTVTGVRVDGPDIHVISGPMPGATIDSTMAFTTTWNRAAEAQEARFSVGDTDGIIIPDTGTYSVAPGSLHADQQAARTNTIRLTRTNRVTPAGAVDGSTFAVSVENELDVVAAPCPSC
jgi:hypothetical protein